MRYLAEGLFFLGLIAFFIAFLWLMILRPAQAMWRRRQAKKRHTADWRVELDYDPYHTIIGLAHPEEGFDPLYSVKKDLQPWDYDDELLDARLKAQQIADSRNRRLPA